MAEDTDGHREVNEGEFGPSERGDSSSSGEVCVRERERGKGKQRVGAHWGRST